ncbi:MAG: ISAs1 family transposase [Planctomycetes bacterium]|nr:ISAs1 family transposase [Planctomycetota bacterium]
MKKGGENWNVADVKPGANGEVFLVKALRAVHVGSATKPILDQMVIPEGRGESTTVLGFYRDLCKVYGRIVECVSLDAAYCTQRVLNAFAVLNVAYIIALKGNAGHVYHRLRKIMGGDGEAPPTGGWDRVTDETRNGRQIRRSFARRFERGDYMEGDFQQVWRQRTVITRKATGELLSVDDRLWITSLPSKRLTVDQSMAAIRAHWGVENDANWTLDAQWGEDSRTWVHKGVARESLGLLRAMAYNLVRVLRHRVLDGPKKGHLSYDELFERIRLALVTPAVIPAAGAT